MSRNKGRGYVGSAILLTLGLLVLAGPVPYVAPDGDYNGDGMVDAIDLQCAILVFEQIELAGQPPQQQCQDDADCEVAFGASFKCRETFSQALLCLPGCLADDVTFGPSMEIDCSDPDAESPTCKGLTQKRQLDLNCDGSFNSVDINFMVAVITGKTGGVGTSDIDGDGKLNGCDDDSDGDLVPDVEDCDPLDPSVNTCDDGNVCTDDSCDPQLGCVNVSNSLGCDDGDACTVDDICEGGVCVSGADKDCDDGNVCTTDSCDASGTCVHTANSLGCDDGNSCTLWDYCENGTCISDTPQNCDDGNICTTNYCSPTSGCVTVNNTLTCNDGDQCTSNDQCSGGLCQGIPIPGCGVPVVVMGEGFESGVLGVFPPEGWTLEMTGAWDWQHSEYAYNGSFSAHHNMSASDARLISPLLDLTGTSGVELSFWQYILQAMQTTQYRVEVSTDGGLTWSAPLYTGPQGTNGWELVVVDLSLYQGATVHLAWHYVAKSQSIPPGRWHIDDVVLKVTD